MASENSLSASEICAIIKACASAKVKDFSLGDLRISYRPRTNEIVSRTPKPKSVPPPDDQPQLALPGTSPSQPTEPQPDESKDLMDMQLAIENPVEWERRLLEEESNG
jgi:hypothetical protein